MINFGNNSYGFVMFVVVLMIVIIIVAMFMGRKNESMASLDFGTFKNNYPFGRCNTGSVKRSPCMIGNCPIGTNITDKEYCDINCAQISDPEMKQSCTNTCLNLMRKCNELH